MLQVIKGQVARAGGAASTTMDVICGSCTAAPEQQQVAQRERGRLQVWCIETFGNCPFEARVFIEYPERGAHNNRWSNQRFHTRNLWKPFFLHFDLKERQPGFHDVTLDRLAKSPLLV